MSTYPEDTAYQIWFDLKTFLTREKRPVFNILFWRNSKSSVWNTNFFPRQATPKILFVLHSNYIGDTPCRVWFDLRLVCRDWFACRDSMPRLVCKKFFLLHSFITLVIIHTKCGSLWTTPWPDKISIFLKVEKTLGKLHQKFFLFYILITLVILPAEVGLICDWFAEIGLHAEIPCRDWFAKNFFCFTLSLHWWLSIPSVVRFEQLLDPIKFLYFWN